MAVLHVLLVLINIRSCYTSKSGPISSIKTNNCTLQASTTSNRASTRRASPVERSIVEHRIRADFICGQNRLVCVLLHATRCFTSQRLKTSNPCARLRCHTEVDEARRTAIRHALPGDDLWKIHFLRYYILSYQRVLGSKSIGADDTFTNVHCQLIEERLKRVHHLHTSKHNLTSLTT